MKKSEIFKLAEAQRAELLRIRREQGEKVAAIDMKQLEEVTSAWLQLQPQEETESAAGLLNAFQAMYTAAASEQPFSEALLNEWHKILYAGTPDGIRTGYREDLGYDAATQYTLPAAEELDHLMGHLENQMVNSKALMHPLEYAAMCYKRILDIRPFREGNEYTAALLLNFVLRQEGYVCMAIAPTKRTVLLEIIQASRKMTNPDIDSLPKLIAEGLTQEQQKYLELLDSDKE
ncbi:MAG: Fic family protein [Lachnospiraceae bacterium]